jgi:hypothetical protein
LKRGDGEEGNVVAEMYCTVDSIFGGDFSTYDGTWSGDTSLPNAVGRAKPASLRSPLKPFSKHLLYVTRREVES